jgi:hypothetical protein
MKEGEGVYVNKPEVTLCCVSRNAVDALALMWESYNYYNPDHPALLYVHDNASTDGALEYAKEHAALVQEGDNTKNHGMWLSELVAQVKTPWVVTVDNDLSFRKFGGMQFAFDHLADDVYVVCPDRYGHPKWEPFGPSGLNIMWRNAYSPNICFGVFHTKVLQKCQQFFHLGWYVDHNTQQAFETGGVVWRVAETCGYHSEELPELWDYVFHHGQISCIGNMTDEVLASEWGQTLQARYDVIKQELADLRLARDGVRR